MKAKTQKERLIDYLEKYGSINPIEALRDLGIYRLSAQIFILRKLGYKIKTDLVDVHNRFSEVCKIANYIYER